MASIIDTIHLTGPLSQETWTDAVDRARERLRLDPRVDPEKLSDVEFVGGSEGYALYHVCAETYGGDMLKVAINHAER